MLQDMCCNLAAMENGCMIYINNKTINDIQMALEK
jgi:hypothetical protein